MATRGQPKQAVNENNDIFSPQKVDAATSCLFTCPGDTEKHHHSFVVMSQAIKQIKVLYLLSFRYFGLHQLLRGNICLFNY